MRFAGWGRGIITDADIEAFLQQAVNYRDMVNGNAWNRTLEFMVLRDQSHPLTAVRATECAEWAGSDQFRRILNDIPDPAGAKPQAGTDDPEPVTGEAAGWPDLFGLLRPKKQEDDRPGDRGGETPEAAGELRWYKKMADEGLITQEQYEQMKKELLGQ